MGMDNTTTEATPEPNEPKFELETIPMPMGDRVLVRRDEAETMSEGGILLPTAAQTKPKQGHVLAIGPGRVLDSGERSEMDVGVGDHVWFSSYAGTDLNGLEEESGFVIMRVDDILAIDQKAPNGAF